MKFKSINAYIGIVQYGKKILKFNKPYHLLKRGELLTCIAAANPLLYSKFKQKYQNKFFDEYIFSECGKIQDIEWEADVEYMKDLSNDNNNNGNDNNASIIIENNEINMTNVENNEINK